MEKGKLSNLDFVDGLMLESMIFSKKVHLTSPYAPLTFIFTSKLKCYFFAKLDMHAVTDMIFHVRRYEFNFCMRAGKIQIKFHALRA